MTNVGNSRSGLAADLTATNRWLGDGETVKETDTGKVKIGPGLWNDLDYEATGSGASVTLPAFADTMFVWHYDAAYTPFAADVQATVPWGAGEIDSTRHGGSVFSANGTTHRVTVLKDCTATPWLYWTGDLVGGSSASVWFDVIQSGSRSQSYTTRMQSVAVSGGPDYGTADGPIPAEQMTLAAGDTLRLDAVCDGSLATWKLSYVEWRIVPTLVAS